MARGRSDDRSTGDARQPYADEGGPQAHHAQTHDVRQEELTRPKGLGPPDDFADDLAAESGVQRAGHTEESTSAVDDKELHGRLGLDADELGRLTVLEAGTRLEQGGTYVDLNDPGRQPFKALASQEAGPDDRYVSKRDTDYELWNKLVGQHRDAEVERPVPAEGS